MKVAKFAYSEYLTWYQGLPKLGKALVWGAFLLFVAYLALQILLHWVVGVLNYERLVEARTRHYKAKLIVYNPGAFSSYDTVIEVQPRSLFSRPCKAFHLARSGPKIADIHWEYRIEGSREKTELVVTVPESAEITPLDQCKDVTFTFVKVPTAEKEDKPSP